MFTKAIVKTPGKSIEDGITSVNLGQPNYRKALQQHKSYIQALKQCGIEVIVLEAEEEFPDSCFVEDTALITDKTAIITNPGAISRKGETASMTSALKELFQDLEEIRPPGTIEAGDIMMVGNHFYIGLSERTNNAGCQQMIELLHKYGHTATSVEMKEMLHLKTGLSYLEDNNLMICGEFINYPMFTTFNKIEVEEEEAYAANCIWVNGMVIVPMGFPVTKKKIQEKGYKTIEVDVSEFQKVDGGLSCLSLRF